MNIFMHELRAYRKSTMVWTLTLIALVLLFMPMFPYIASEFNQLKKLLAGFPVALQKALGLQIDRLGSILGYYSYTFTYISLCGAIQAMILGTSIISKEFREKTADFLMTKPVTRTQILTSKLLAAVASLLITNVVYIVATSLIVSQVKVEDYNSTALYLISITLLFVQLIFLAIGTIVSVIFSKIKSVLAVSLGTVFTFFIIGMLASTDGDGVKRILSPFKYFEPNYIIQNSSYEASYMILGAGIILVAMIASFVIYAKKDIDAV